MRTAHSPAAALAALLACLVVCACSGAAADPVTPQDALAAAQTWLSLDDTPLGCHLGGMIGGVRPWIDGTGRTLFYIASLQPEGYIILSPDNLVEPIVAFSHTGDYDSSPANPMSSLASRDLASRLDLVRNRQPLQGADPAASSAAAKWNMLLGLTPAPLAGLSGISDPRVSPMVQSRWSQSNEGAACYNYYVPPNSDGSTSNHPCGCVATAMAQTMRFFQYPASGIGVHSFSISVCGAIAARSTRGGDGSGGAYNWALMTLDPDSSTSTESRQQIGALCADAGFAVNMDYCSDGSGIYDLQKVVDRLKGTFLYSNAKRAYNGTANLSSTAIQKTVTANLHAGYPVMLGITSPQYGHMVVCDGYGYNSSTLYHHLNMGWAGTSDAWYNLPNIDAAYTFDTVSTVVYNIYTTGSGEIIAGRVTDGSGNPISGATVNATLGASSYSDTTDGYGIYGIGKVPSGTQFTVSAAAPGYSFASRTVTTGISQDATNTSGNQAGIDFQATLTSPPSFPVDGTPVAASATAITWKWVDVSGETGYRVRDTAGVMKSGDLAADLVQWTEGSLQPNTSYTRRIHSFNASGESAGSSGQSRYTLARAGQSTDGTGATGNVYCTTAATNTWYGGSKLFTFSNPAGFGANGAWMASSFQYKWNTQAAEGWSSAGAGWTAGTISLTPTSGEGDYYLHVRALNAEGAANNLDVLNYGPFRVDCTAPSALSVSDEGAYTPALDSLSASWTASSDAKSGLDHYEYAIGTSASLQNIRQWSSTGASTSVTASPVGLTEGVTYYLQARAVDKVGNVSPGSAADGILTAPGVATIPQAWAKQNGVEPLSLRDKMVTYTSAGEFCMQETDKPFAIRVVSPANPAIGSTISIAGVLGVQGTQRVLIGGVYKQPNGSTGNTPARVVSMIGRNLGGCNFNPTTPGVPGSMGPYNLGTLARICGRVTYTNTSNASMKYFCVDDGSGLSSATRAGVRIYTGTADPPRRGYASVSGVIMSESIGGVTVPVLMIRDSSDINSF